MKTDDNDKLWELLGKCREPEVSPFFSRNVLRAVRQDRQEQDARPSCSFFRWLHRSTWQIAIACTCAMAALITVTPGAFVRHHHSVPDTKPVFARQIVGNPDYEIIKHLDELVADEESSLWLDESVN